MLINDDSVMTPDPILCLIGMGGKGEKIQDGIYKINGFGCSSDLPDYEHYPETTVGSYGVCDGVDNLLEKCPELEYKGRNFVVTLTQINKKDEPSSGGWRWHKWGGYIGNKDPQYEYIYDEEDIETVYCFHIYEKTN